MWSRLTILLTLWLWSLTHSLNVHIRAVEVGFVVDDGHRWYELCWSARLVSSYIVSICTIRSNKAKQLLRVFHSIVTWTVDRLKLSIVGCCVFSHYTVNTPVYAQTASLTGALMGGVYVSIHGNSGAASASNGSGHPLQLQPTRLEHSSVYH